MLQPLLSSFGCLVVWVLCFPHMSRNSGFCATTDNGEAKRKRNLWVAFPGEGETHPAPEADPLMIQQIYLERRAWAGDGVSQVFAFRGLSFGEARHSHVKTIQER